MIESYYEYIDTLVALTQSGDSDALASLAEFYLPLILKCIQRICANEPKLTTFRDDIHSESILVLRELVEVYDPTLSYFSYFLKTRLEYALMARSRRLFINQTSQGVGIEEVNFSDMPVGWEPESQDDPMGRAETEQVVQAAILKLSKQQQEAVRLYFFEELTQDEAAAQLNITQASFCKRLKRAIARLKILLGGEFTGVTGNNSA